MARVKRRWWLLRILAVLVIAAIAIIYRVRMNDPLRSPARRRWKDQAITQITKHVNDKPWLDKEIALRNAAVAKRESNAWIGDEIILAKNGEWMVCENVAAKEQIPSITEDLFIGRGSDGKWYYSTFHFCIGKVVLAMERQPATLAQFVDGYGLVPFDPKSDDCLNVTWSGGPYGDEKRMISATSPTTNP